MPCFSWCVRPWEDQTKLWFETPLSQHKVTSWPLVVWDETHLCGRLVLLESELKPHPSITPLRAVVLTAHTQMWWLEAWSSIFFLVYIDIGLDAARSQGVAVVFRSSCLNMDEQMDRGEEWEEGEEVLFILGVFVVPKNETASLRFDFRRFDGHLSLRGLILQLFSSVVPRVRRRSWSREWLMLTLHQSLQDGAAVVPLKTHTHFSVCYWPFTLTTQGNMPNSNHYFYCNLTVILILTPN